MRPDKDHLRAVHPAAPNADGGFRLSTLAKAGVATAAESIAFVVHYSAYTQTMNLMPGGNLAEIPGIAWMFADAPDIQINHLIAGLMALASVATPVFSFYYLMRERVIDEPQAFFSYLPNRLYLALIGLFWALMIGVEILNVLTLIQTHTQNPFQRSQVAEALLTHSGLALLSAVVIAIVNSALALATARVWIGILDKMED